MKEREISLLDLLVEILLQWRKIIIWMVAGAVLLGAFSYVQSYYLSRVQAEQAKSEKEKSVEEQKEDMKMLENQLSAEQLADVQEAIAYGKMYEDALTYQKESVLMQIDPNKVQKAELTFCIDSGNRKKNGEVERVYEDLVQSAQLRAYAAKAVQSDALSLEGGITLSRGSGSLPDGSPTFWVKICHYDADACRSIAQAVIRFLNEKHDALAKTMGEHELSVVNESYAQTADGTILEFQKKNRSDTNAVKAAVAQYVDAFTPEQQTYYEYLIGEEAGTEVERETEEQRSEMDDNAVIVPGVSMRYLILGIVLGAFLCAFAIFLRYVLSTRIHAADNLQELFGIVQLGSIPRQGEKKRWFGFADKWILSLRSRGRRIFTKEEALKLSVAAVKMAAMKENLSTVTFLIGSGQEPAMSLCQAVSRQLEQENIQADVLEHVLYDAGAMSDLEHAEGVVLIEQAGADFYDEVTQQLELLKRLEIPVLGGILVE